MTAAYTEGRLLVRRLIGYLLAVMGVDTISTACFLATGRAIERNPLYGPILQNGLSAFLLYRLVFMLAAWAILLLGARRHPRFVIWATTFCIAGYAFLYVRNLLIQVHAL